MTYIQGQEFGSRIIKALGLPNNTRSIEIRIAVNEIVTVRCEYFPDTEIGAIEKELKDFYLTTEKPPEAP